MRICMLLTSLLNRTLIKTKIFTFFSPSSTAISIYWNGTEVPPCAPAGGGGDQLTLGTFTLLSLPGARQPLRAHRLRHLRHFPTRERGACAFDTWVGKTKTKTTRGQTGSRRACV